MRYRIGKVEEKIRVYQYGCRHDELGFLVKADEKGLRRRCSSKVSGCYTGEDDEGYEVLGSDCTSKFVAGYRIFKQGIKKFYLKKFHPKPL